MGHKTTVVVTIYSDNEEALDLIGPIEAVLDTLSTKLEIGCPHDWKLKNGRIAGSISYFIDLIPKDQL